MSNLGNIEKITSTIYDIFIKKYNPEKFKAYEKMLLKTDNEDE